MVKRNIVADLYFDPNSFSKVNKVLAFALGIEEATLFSELVSRQKLYRDAGQLVEDEYFYRTEEDVYLETGLTRKRQDRCIKILSDAELIEAKVKGLPPKRHFRICSDEWLNASMTVWYYEREIAVSESKIKYYRKVGNFEKMHSQEARLKENKELFSFAETVKLNLSETDKFNCPKRSTSNNINTNNKNKTLVSSKEDTGAIAPSLSQIGDDDELQKNLFSIKQSVSDEEKELAKVKKMSLSDRAIRKAEMIREGKMDFASLSNSELYAYFCKKQKAILGDSPLDGKTPKDIAILCSSQGKILLTSLRTTYKLSDDEILDTLDKLAEAYLKEDREQFKCLTGNTINKMTDLVNKLLGNKVVKKAKERANWIKESDKEGTTRRRVNRDKFS